MVSIRKSTLWPLLVTILIGFFLPSTAPRAQGKGSGLFEWRVHKVNGREYVSMKDIKAFYRFDSLSERSSQVVLKTGKVTLVGSIGSQTLSINKIKFIMSFPMLEDDGDAVISRLDLSKLVDPVLRPLGIRNRDGFDTVIIDPGHGGYDSGATCPLGKESDYALDTARILRSELKRRGFKVLLTRDSDTYITLGDRVKMANKYTKAIFVSLHYNSGQSRAYGIETFALSPQGASSTYTGSRSSDGVNFNGNKRDSENIALATAIHVQAMHHINQTIDRGIKRARWSVLTGLKLPGILFEGGFLSNPGEAKAISTRGHREKIAKAIAIGIENFHHAMME